MDTSKQYVEMCEKATEIQSVHDITDYEHDIVYCRACEGVCHEDSGYYFCCGETDGLWLPQQDDLQEMWAIHEYGNERANNWTTFVLDQFSYWVLSGNAGLSTLDISMEQLWLAFVMKELHNKAWNGTDWIKE